MNRWLAIICLFLLPFFANAENGKISVGKGQKIYYEEYGQGEPVILLHGHTLDRRMWKGQVELLRDSFRVIVPDLRGYGLSSDPLPAQQFTYTDDVIALMDSLSIGKAHVVGLSMGAYVAGELLAMHPDRVLSCMMVAGEICGRPGPSTPKTKEERERQRIGNEKILRQGLDKYKNDRVEDLIRRAGSRGEEMRDALTEMIMEWGAWQVTHVTARIYYGQEAFQSLKRNKPDVRTLIVYGELEGKKPSRMLNYLPHAEQITIPNCGHMVNMEQPEQFNSLLLRWLRGLPVEE